MKILSYFHLLFLCSLWTFSSFAQADFAPIGAKWHYEYYDVSATYVGYMRQESVKDTVIEGQLCKKLERTIISKHRSRLFDSPIDTTQMSALYLYSSPDTVFYYNGEFKRFLPLYIFNRPLT